MSPFADPARVDPITADCLAEARGIRHGFFTRNGGVSGGSYASLNCGLGSKDDATLVAANRVLITRHLGQPAAAIITPHQVHSATAVVADRPWPPDQIPKADAIVTRTPGLVIGVLAADCTPVLFADPEARIVGAAHAGWKGALGGILEATVTAMQRLGARPSRIAAAVGPCINQAAYEVGPEFEARFLAADAGHARYFRRADAGSRPHFDLPGFVAGRLALLELATIEHCAVCTYANDSQFYSYRRSTHRHEPDYGRQISAIVVA